MKVWRYGGVQYPSLHTRFFAPKSTDVTIIVQKRQFVCLGNLMRSQCVDPLQMCVRQKYCAKTVPYSQRTSQELIKTTCGRKACLKDMYKLLLCRELCKISYCNPQGRSLCAQQRSVLKIGNTSSRVPDGGGACQRCAPGSNASTREAIKVMGTPKRRMLLNRSCSRGYDERLCWALPRRIGWVQIMHAGRQNWRLMGRQTLVLARKSSGHIGRYIRPLRRGGYI